MVRYAARGMTTHYMRPTAEHALQVATEMFLAGERVDLVRLSARVGVGRTTMHRWVGDRERLLGRVVADLTDTGWAIVAVEAEGEGEDRAVDIVRRFMVFTSTWGPLRSFVERESQLALRILCSPDSPVPARIGAGIARAFAANVPEVDRPSPEFVDILVQLGTAMQWTPIVVGDEAPVARAVDLLRWLRSATLA
jgi:AcrR family transcriptional regulator